MPPLSPPPRSPRQQLKSPPPSAPLMKLQSLGLELGASGLASSLQLPYSKPSSRGSSRATTRSDLDKPLPLEPAELRKRTSSIYSIETTITKIIDLYHGATSAVQNDGYLPGPEVHQASAYRDTLVTLMNSRMSWEGEDPAPMPPMPKMPLHVETSAQGAPTRHDHQDVSPVVFSATDNKTAPSFVEFSTNLQRRRTEMVSPLSATSLEQHRKAALGALAPPSRSGASSADMSPCDGTEFQHSNAFLPDPTSATISETVTPNTVLPPLDLNRTSGVVESHEAARLAHEQHLGIDDDDDLDLNTPYPEYEDVRWSDDSSSYKSIGEVSRHRVKETVQEPFLNKEDQRIISYAAEKYPAMKGTNPPPHKNSWRSSGGSSLTMKASSFARRMSLSNRENSDKSRYSPIEDEPLVRQRAIPRTPDQVYGPALFIKNSHKKFKDHRGQSSLQHQQGSGFDCQEYPEAMHRSQTAPDAKDYDEADQGRGLIGSALQRMSKRSSQKRREKLKNSIVLVRPSHSSNKSGMNAVASSHKWL